MRVAPHWGQMVGGMWVEAFGDCLMIYKDATNDKRENKRFRSKVSMGTEVEWNTGYGVCCSRITDIGAGEPLGGDHKACVREHVHRTSYTSDSVLLSHFGGTYLPVLFALWQHQTGRRTGKA